MIASYIAFTAVVVFLARFILRQIHNKKIEVPITDTAGRSSFYFYSVLAGALFANAIPHFIHGISGESFPAPFSYKLGRGMAANIANVLWGLFNFGAGCYLARSLRGTDSRTKFRVLACTGFIITSLLLSVIFSTRK